MLEKLAQDWGCTLKEAAMLHTAAQFRRTQDGTWVVFGSVDEVKRGKVRVQKKDGRMSDVMVTRLGRPFNVNGIPHVYGYFESEKPSGNSGTSRNHGTRSDVCDNCFKPLRGRGSPARDSSGIPGIVCPQCARMSQYERSYA
jgi:hypothetical protein